MSGPGATRGKDGKLAVTGIPPLLAEVVRELPSFIGAEEPRQLADHLGEQRRDPRDAEVPVAAADRRQLAHGSTCSIVARSCAAWSLRT